MTINLRTLDDDLQPWSTHSEIRHAENEGDSSYLIVEFERLCLMIWDNGTICESDGTVFTEPLGIILEALYPTPLLREALAEAIFRSMNNRHSPDLRYEWTDPHIGDRAAIYDEADHCIRALRSLTHAK